MAKAKEKEKKKEKSPYWKHPEYGFITGPKFVTPMGRVTWASLVKPKEWKGKVEEGKKIPDPKWEITFKFPKDNAKVKLFFEDMELHKDEMVRMFNEGKKSTITVEATAADGDKDFNFEEYPSLEHYKGHWILQARLSRSLEDGVYTEPPKIYGMDNDKDGNPIPIEAGKVTGGVLARGVISPIVTAAGGITYKLHDVQLLRDDGVRYGSVKAGLTMLAESANDLLDDLPALSTEGTSETVSDQDDTTSLEQAANNVLA